MSSSSQEASSQRVACSGLTKRGSCDTTSLTRGVGIVLWQQDDIARRGDIQRQEPKREEERERWGERESERESERKRERERENARQNECECVCARDFADVERWGPGPV